MMLKLVDANAEQLKDMSFQGWRECLVELKKERLLEEEEKKAAKAFLETSQAKQELARNMLANMNAGCDVELVEKVFSTWANWVITVKKQAELNDALEACRDQFAMFAQMSGKNAYGMKGQEAEARDFGMQNHAFLIWLDIIRTESVIAYYENVIKSQDTQIMQLQGYFGVFENEFSNEFNEMATKIDGVSSIPVAARSGPIPQVAPASVGQGLASASAPLPSQMADQ